MAQAQANGGSGPGAAAAALLAALPPDADARDAARALFSLEPSSPAGAEDVAFAIFEHSIRAHGRADLMARVLAAVAAEGGPRAAQLTRLVLQFCEQAFDIVPSEGQTEAYANKLALFVLVAALFNTGVLSTPRIGACIAELLAPVGAPPGAPPLPHDLECLYVLLSGCGARLDACGDESRRLMNSHMAAVSMLSCHPGVAPAMHGLMAELLSARATGWPAQAPVGAAGAAGAPAGATCPAPVAPAAAHAAPTLAAAAVDEVAASLAHASLAGAPERQAPPAAQAAPPQQQAFDYLAPDGKAYGLFSLAQLQEWVAAGHLAPDVQVRAGPYCAWAPLPSVARGAGAAPPSAPARTPATPVLPEPAVPAPSPSPAGWAAVPAPAPRPAPPACPEGPRSEQWLLTAARTAPTAAAAPVQAAPVPPAAASAPAPPAPAANGWRTVPGARPAAPQQPAPLETVAATRSLGPANPWSRGAPGVPQQRAAPAPAAPLPPRVVENTSRMADAYQPPPPGTTGNTGPHVSRAAPASRGRKHKGVGYADDKEWLVCAQRGKVTGPMTGEALLDLLNNDDLEDDCFVKKADWKDYKSIDDTFEMIVEMYSSKPRGRSSRSSSSRENFYSNGAPDRPSPPASSSPTHPSAPDSSSQAGGPPSTAAAPASASRQRQATQQHTDHSHWSMHAVGFLLRSQGGGRAAAATPPARRAAPAAATPPAAMAAAGAVSPAHGMTTPPAAGARAAAATPAMPGSVPAAGLRGGLLEFTPSSAAGASPAGKQHRHGVGGQPARAAWSSSSSSEEEVAAWPCLAQAAAAGGLASPAAGAAKPAFASWAALAARNKRA